MIRFCGNYVDARHIRCNTTFNTETEIINIIYLTSKHIHIISKATYSRITDANEGQHIMLSNGRFTQKHISFNLIYQLIIAQCDDLHRLISNINNIFGQINNIGFLFHFFAAHLRWACTSITCATDNLHVRRSLELHATRGQAEAAEAERALEAVEELAVNTLALEHHYRCSFRRAQNSIVVSVFFLFRKLLLQVNK